MFNRNFKRLKRLFQHSTAPASTPEPVDYSVVKTEGFGDLRLKGDVSDERTRESMLNRHGLLPFPSLNDVGDLNKICLENDRLPFSVFDRESQRTLLEAMKDDWAGRGFTGQHPLSDEIYRAGFDRDLRDEVFPPSDPDRITIDFVSLTWKPHGDDSSYGFSTWYRGEHGPEQLAMYQQGFADTLGNRGIETVEQAAPYLNFYSMHHFTAETQYDLLDQVQRSELGVEEKARIIGSADEGAQVRLCKGVANYTQTPEEMKSLFNEKIRREAAWQLALTANSFDDLPPSLEGERNYVIGSMVTHMFGNHADELSINAKVAPQAAKMLASLPATEIVAALSEHTLLNQDNDTPQQRLAYNAQNLFRTGTSYVFANDLERANYSGELYELRKAVRSALGPELTSEMARSLAWEHVDTQRKIDRSAFLLTDLQKAAEHEFGRAVEKMGSSRGRSSWLKGLAWTIDELMPQCRQDGFTILSDDSPERRATALALSAWSSQDEIVADHFSKEERADLIRQMTWSQEDLEAHTNRGLAQVEASSTAKDDSVTHLLTGKSGRGSSSMARSLTVAATTSPMPTLEGCRKVMGDSNAYVIDTLMGTEYVHPNKKLDWSRDILEVADFDPDNSVRQSLRLSHVARDEYIVEQ